jgi:hypothetical protein
MRACLLPTAQGFEHRRACLRVHASGSPRCTCTHCTSAFGFGSSIGSGGTTQLTFSGFGNGKVGSFGAGGGLGFSTSGAFGGTGGGFSFGGTGGGVTSSSFTFGNASKSVGFGDVSSGGWTSKKEEEDATGEGEDEDAEKEVQVRQRPWSRVFHSFSNDLSVFNDLGAFAFTR